MAAANPRLRWIAVLAWMGVIFFLSAQSVLPHLSTFLDAVQDVLGHFAIYGILAILVHWALTGSGATQPTRYTMLIGLLYALSDEFHQRFVPGRHPDPFDILTDLAGAAAALLALRLLRFHRARHPLP